MIQIVNAVFEIVGGIIVSIFNGIFDFISDALSNRKTEYDADFIHPTEILSSYEEGFCVTGSLSISLKRSYENLLCVGPTGVGKSTIVIFTSLYKMDANYFIHDPSGEIHQATCGFLESKGYEIVVLNFSDPVDGFNPVARANSSTEINKLSSMIVQATLSKSSDNFWNLQSTALLTLLISLLKTQKTEYQNLINVQRLLNVCSSKPELLDLLFVRCGNPYLLDEWKAINGYEPKVLSNIIATSKAALSFLNDESIRRVTSFDTIDINGFRKKKFAVFLQNSVADQKYFSVLTSIFFEQAFASILRKLPKDSDRDVFFIIDECATLRIPTLPVAVSNLRKFHGGCLIAIQSISQLFENYSRHDAETISSNCFSKLYFTGGGLSTTQDLEASLGRFEFEDEQGQRKIMPLMTSDSIRTMDPSRGLLICGHHKPMKVRLKPYYNNWRMRRYSKLPASPMKCKIPFEEIPLLPLSESKKL